MIKQLDLQFPSAAAPLQQDPEAERLIAYLDANAGFHKAHELRDALGYTDRKIRQLAEQSNGLIVSGPGSPGYIHISHCPPEKLAHIADTLQSQARHMLRRAFRLRKTAHTIIR